MPDDAFQKAIAGIKATINRHPAQTPYHVAIDTSTSMPAGLVHQRGQAIVQVAVDTAEPGATSKP